MLPLDVHQLLLHRSKSTSWRTPVRSFLWHHHVASLHNVVCIHVQHLPLPLLPPPSMLLLLSSPDPLRPGHPSSRQPNLATRHCCDCPTMQHQASDQCAVYHTPTSALAAAASCCCHQVLVGPGTPRPAHPIQSPEVAEFVSSATSGLVLVAFGSTYQSAALLYEKDVYELVASFQMLAPVRVLVAMSDSHLPGGMRVTDLELDDNVMTVPWVDYNVSGRLALQRLRKYHVCILLQEVLQCQHILLTHVSSSLCCRCCRCWLF